MMNKDECHEYLSILMGDFCTMLHNKYKAASRLLCLLLALTIPAISSCGKQTLDSQQTSAQTDNENNSSETTVETELVPDLPAYDGGGRDFTILGKMEVNMSGRWTALDVYVEEQNGEIVNDAVYDRNIELENKYNINIKYKTWKFYLLFMAPYRHKNYNQLRMMHNNFKKLMCSLK